MSHVRGTLRLRQVARQLRDATPELRKELRDGIRKPVKSFEGAIRGEVPGSVPARYASVLAPDIRVRLLNTVQGNGLGYTLEVYAKGKGEDRDVRATNAGLLRHKTFGREPWVSQRVRGGFVDRPVEKFAKQIYDEVNAAVEHAAEKIEGA